MLLIGTEQTRTKSGGFHPDVMRIVSAFEGPLLLVAGAGWHLEEPEQCPARILVPVAGTDVSRRAAEVAIAIGRAHAAQAR